MQPIQQKRADRYESRLMNEEIEARVTYQESELYQTSFYLVNLFSGPYSKQGLVNLTGFCAICVEKIEIGDICKNGHLKDEFGPYRYISAACTCIYDHDYDDEYCKVCISLGYLPELMIKDITEFKFLPKYTTYEVFCYSTTLHVRVPGNGLACLSSRKRISFSELLHTIQKHHGTNTDRKSSCNHTTTFQLRMYFLQFTNIF